MGAGRRGGGGGGRGIERRKGGVDVGWQKVFTWIGDAALFHTVGCL